MGYGTQDETIMLAPWPTVMPEENMTHWGIDDDALKYVEDKHEMIRQSERVYNFQRIFNLRRGFGTRKHDAQPYRAAGPVTAEEYNSLAEQYDKQMKEDIGVSPEGKTVEEKMAITRKYREEQYEKLLDAVYQRRGWTKNGVPTIEHLKNLGMDLPELIEVITPHQ